MTRRCATAGCCCGGGAAPSEVQFYGSRKGEKRFLAEVDGMDYDSLFVFEELGWNFEPSELGAAFGLEQLNKLPRNYQVRQRNFARYQEFLGEHREHFDPPVQAEGLETAWLAYPFVVRPESGMARSDFQAELEDRGIDTVERPVAIPTPIGSCSMHCCCLAATSSATISTTCARPSPMCSKPDDRSV